MSEDNDQLVEVVSNEKEDIATVRVLEQRAEVAALPPKDAVEAAASDEAKAAGEAPARTAAVTEVRKDYRLAHPEAAVDVDKEAEAERRLDQEELSVSFPLRGEHRARCEASRVCALLRRL